MTDNVTVKLDPRRPLTKSALMHALNNADHDADEQVVADMVMAMMILAELSGLGLEDLEAMVTAGQVNAARAAARLSLQITTNKAMTDTINSHSRRMYNAQKETRADLAPAPAGKVKALVWQRNGDHHAGGYGYVIRKMGSRYTLTVRNNHGQNFDTLEAAKAAAQAHHDATILAALEPATPLDDPRVKALVEAGKVWIVARANTVGDALTPDRWTELSKAESALCAALSALEESK